MFKKIPSTVLLLGIVSFFNDIASEMIYPIIPIFLTQVLGAPVYILGIIEGIAEGLSSVLKTVFGVWSDKLQKRKPFVFTGYLSSTLGKIIISLAYSWPLVFLGRVTDRFGKGLRTAARDALLLETTDQTNRGFIFGLHRSFDSSGAVIGPLIAIILLQFFEKNLRPILYLAIIPSFVSLIFFLFIKDTKKKLAVSQIKFIFTLKNLPYQFKLFLIVMALFSLGNSSDTFLILRANNLGISLSLTVLAYVLYNFIYALFSAPFGRLSDIIGPKKVFIFGLLIYSLVYLGFAVNNTVALIWPLFLIYGLYIALTDGVSKALVGSFINPQISGTAYGILQTFISIFTLLASVIGGVLWSTVSPSATFYFGSICAFAALLLMSVLL